MAQASPAPDGAVIRMVQAQGGRLHSTDHPGQDPALVLLHGFPDDSRIYDRLVPLLASRRSIALDWLGYGRSDRVEPGSLADAAHHTSCAPCSTGCSWTAWPWSATTPVARTPSNTPWASPAGWRS